MTNTKSTKRALLSSVLALVVCIAMLVGSTFAWFTDNASTAVNQIVAGNLDIALEMWDANADNAQGGKGDWVDAQDKTLNWVTKDGRTTNILWEPGCTYELPKLRIINKGNLALKYQVLVTGIVGDADLLDVIEFTGIPQGNEYVSLLPGKSNEFVIKGHMLETAGNEYMGKEIKDISITVHATQDTVEYDSYNNQYDADAPFDVWDGTTPTTMPNTLVVDPTTRTITVNDAAAFAYLNQLGGDTWKTLYTNGQGSEYSNYAPQNGGKGVDYYYHWGWDVKLNCNIDLDNKAWTPIDLSFFRAFKGQGHTVKNVNVKATANNAGLFADVRGGISYLTVDNVSINAGDYTSVGAVAGNLNGVVDTVTVNGAIVTGKKYVGGIIGYGYASIVNSSVSNSVISIAAGGEKEAGGLAGYICTTSEEKVKNNVVTDTVISAPTVASALVSQPNGKYAFTNNKVVSTTVTTSDDTADIFVSNNVGGKATLANNTQKDCTVNKAGALTKVAFPATASETKTALNSGANYIDAQGANLGKFSYIITSSNVPAGETLTFKNATLDGWNYGNAVDGTVVFENCKFTSSSAYSIHFDAGNGYVVFNNCVLEGWCSFGSAIKGVTFNDCTILGNGIYSIVRCYQDFTMNNCVIDASNTITDDVYQDGIDVVAGYTATMVNCINLNGDIKDVFEAEDIAGTDGKVIFK